jgi:hypothetical protein
MEQILLKNGNEPYLSFRLSFTDGFGAGKFSVDYMIEKRKEPMIGNDFTI